MKPYREWLNHSADHSPARLLGAVLLALASVRQRLEHTDLEGAQLRLLNMEWALDQALAPHPLGTPFGGTQHQQDLQHPLYLALQRFYTERLFRLKPGDSYASSPGGTGPGYHVYLVSVAEIEQLHQLGWLAASQDGSDLIYILTPEGYRRYHALQFHLRMEDGSHPLACLQEAS